MSDDGAGLRQDRRTQSGARGSGCAYHGGLGARHGAPGWFAAHGRSTRYDPLLRCTMAKVTELSNYAQAKKTAKPGKPAARGVGKSAAAKAAAARSAGPRNRGPRGDR